MEDDLVRHQELKKMFDEFLPNATDDELNKVTSIQYELHKQQLRIGKLHNKGIMNDEEFAHAINAESRYALQLISGVLGEARCKLLFGLDNFDQVALVDSRQVRENQTRLKEPEIANLEMQVVKILKRYTPSKSEQTRVKQIVKKMSPQKSNAILKYWDPRAKYSDLASKIEAAEKAYHTGDIQKSIDLARTVVSKVVRYQKVTDSPLYLTGWAHHIQGRGYDALRNWSLAASHYQASLLCKTYLKEWLPPMPILATEIKLSSLEAYRSPNVAATHLSRVADYISSSRKLSQQNVRMYRYLLKDSYVSLAEAYLASGNESLALKEARSALRISRILKDRVSEIRILFLLCRTCNISLESTRKRVNKLLEEEMNVASHPQVTNIIGKLEKLE